MAATQSEGFRWGLSQLKLPVHGGSRFAAAGRWIVAAAAVGAATRNAHSRLTKKEAVDLGRIMMMCHGNAQFLFLLGRRKQHG